jgi:hypothetical protein
VEQALKILRKLRSATVLRKTVLTIGFVVAGMSTPALGTLYSNAGVSAV